MIEIWNLLCTYFVFDLWPDSVTFFLFPLFIWRVAFCSADCYYSDCIERRHLVTVEHWLTFIFAPLFYVLDTISKHMHNHTHSRNCFSFHRTHCSSFFPQRNEVLAAHWGKNEKKMKQIRDFHEVLNFFFHSPVESEMFNSIYFLPIFFQQIIHFDL